MHRQSTVLAWCILILGMFGIAGGSDVLIRGAVHAEGSSCKAICGLSLLLAQLLGAAAGAIALGVIYVMLGVFLLCIGYLMLKDK
ncbi:hypothetical protein [Aquitalea sp. ASV11]|uniref:hypothetical protein n=1 Tax=Aquitalea sp. ASV11 TaxID=2795103 RepID=UPI0018EA3D9D|nr:hypothetical protein [Aquitalea sp. ASV11]